MYHVEVMSKLPVVQHFPFGSLFSFDRDPDAVGVPESSHSSNQPQRSLARESSSDLTATAMPVQTQAVTSAPWAVGRTGPPIGQETQAPWARTPLSKPHGALPSDFVPTKAPWAK
jgi:serine/threonine-protein phosphatase 2A activator